MFHSVLKKGGLLWPLCRFCTCVLICSGYKDNNTNNELYLYSTLQNKVTWLKQEQKHFRSAKTSTQTNTTMQIKMEIKYPKVIQKIESNNIHKMRKGGQ